MMLATQTTRTTWNSTSDTSTGDRSLAANLGLEVMRPIRRAAIRLLDMRTEFETLDPWVAPQAGPGRMASLGLAVARQVRRFVSKRLDLWTEFETLD